MKNTLAIAKYELKRLFSNWKFVLLVLSQPIVISIIAGLMANHAPENIEVAVIDQNPSKYSREIRQKIDNDGVFNVNNFEKSDENRIISGDYRAEIIFNLNDDLINNTIYIKHDPSSGIIKDMVNAKISKYVAESNKDIASERSDKQKQDIKSSIREKTGMTISLNEITDENSNLIETEAGNIKSTETVFFDYYGSAMTVLLIFLVVLNISGISITSERVKGTFERIAATPYTKMNILIGKALAHFLVGAIIATIGVISMHILFNITVGNIFLLGIVTLLTVAIAVSIGLLISSTTSGIVESVELAMYTFFISVLTGGIITPIETANSTFKVIYKILPFYYAVDASKRINVSGASWDHIKINVYALIAFYVLFSLLALFLLRRETSE